MRSGISDQDAFIREFKFQTSRSSGPGGQNVNKVSSRVELRFNLKETQLLNEDEKDILYKKLASRISQEGILIIVVQIDRSQLRNKQLAIERFFKLVAYALKPEKQRRATKPSRAARERRLQAKRLGAEKKARRRASDWKD